MLGSSPTKTKGKAPGFGDLGGPGTIPPTIRPFTNLHICLVRIGWVRCTRKDDMNFYHAIKDRILGKAPKGAKRSSQWRKVRGEHIEREPACQICPRTKKLEVHHKIPFHVSPALELEEHNLVTLCHRCHLIFGHLGNYRSVNISIDEDVVLWNHKISNR